MLSIVVAVLCMLITWNAVLLRRVNEITAQMAENVEMVARLKAGYGDSIEKTNKTMHILTSGVKAMQAMVKDNSVQVDNIMESFSNIHLRMAAYENSIPSVSAPAESVRARLCTTRRDLKRRRPVRVALWIRSIACQRL